MSTVIMTTVSKVVIEPSPTSGYIFPYMHLMLIYMWYWPENHVTLTNLPVGQPGKQLASHQR